MKGAKELRNPLIILYKYINAQLDNYSALLWSLRWLISIALLSSSTCSALVLCQNHRNQAHQATRTQLTNHVATHGLIATPLFFVSTFKTTRPLVHSWSKSLQFKTHYEIACNECKLIQQDICLLDFFYAHKILAHTIHHRFNNMKTCAILIPLRAAGSTNSTWPARMTAQQSSFIHYNPERPQPCNIHTRTFAACLW